MAKINTPIDNQKKNASAPDVPEGYKITEVGVIPKDWDSVPFGDFFESNIKKKNIKPSDIVSFVGMQDISENANLIRTTQVPFEKVKSGFTYFEKNDVLVAKITPCFENGKGCYVSTLPTDIGFGSTEFHVLRANEKSDSCFIYYWTTEKKLRYSLESEMVGSAGHRRVPLNAFKEYPIPVPRNKAEQILIAHALADTDELLSVIKNLITKKQSIKTATMQQLLTGKTRLPQFTLHKDGTVKGYKKSELGKIPEDWNVDSYRSVMTIKHGKSQKEVESNNGLYPIYATGGKIGMSTSFLYNKPSVLIGRKGTIDKPRYIESPFWTVDTLFYSEISPLADAKFIYYKFCMINWMQYNEASGVPSLNASTIENILASFPDKQEQITIANILYDMDKEIQLLQQKLEKTRDIKQGMMQQLLTGKIRLVKPASQGKAA